MAYNRIYKAAIQGLLSLTYFSCFATDSTDSLNHKDFKYLFTKIRAYSKAPQIQDIYLKAFLNNAKASKDWELIMNAYKNYADYADDDLAIAYCDSMVFAAQQSANTKLIGSACLSKGITYYALKKHDLALQYYLQAKPYIEKANDDYLNYKLKYNIAHVKYYLGKNDEAIGLFNSCLEYFRLTNDRAYLNTLHSLGLCYNSAGNYGKSTAMVNLGFNEANRLNNHSMDFYFMHLDGQNDYFLSNYSLAIQKLGKSIPILGDNKDYGNIAVANFYIGKSYWMMKRFRESVPYFEKVAATFDQRGYIRPDLRENFELLIRYYRDKGTPKEALFYVEKLLKADSLLLSKHDTLYDNIRKEYDTKELIREKENIKKELSDERSGKRHLITGAAILGIITALVLGSYEKNRRRQNRIFKELLQEKKDIHKPEKDAVKEFDIAPETLEKVLRLLEKWEQANRFLEVDVTQSMMAVHLDTNIRYVSDIILYYRGKKFSDYINDLKVDYIIEQLKTDKHKRMYTHDALAKEAGFSTTRRFVMAFKARTGISPNFFSARIRKQIDESNA